MTEEKKTIHLTHRHENEKKIVDDKRVRHNTQIVSAWPDRCVHKSSLTQVNKYKDTLETR